MHDCKSLFAEQALTPLSELWEEQRPDAINQWKSSLQNG